MSHPSRNGLRLVADEPRLRRQKIAKQWLLETAPDPLPDHPALLVQLEDIPSEVGSEDLSVAIEELVAAQRLARIQIGGVRHITRQSAGQLTTEDEARHRLEVQLDIEAERQLLYRLGLVLEGIGLFLIARHAVLASLIPLPFA